MSIDVASAPFRRFLPVMAAGVTVTLWASAFVGIRAAGQDYSPGALTFARQLTASIVLTVVVLVIAAYRGRPALPRGRDLVGVIVWGVAWFGLYNLALNAAGQRIDAGTMAMLVNLAPALIAVFAGLMLGEGFAVRLIAGIAVAFTGVAVIAVTSSTGRHDLAGVALGLTAALLYASCATAQKPLLSRVSPLIMTWIGCLAGAVASLPFAGVFAQEVVTASVSSTLTVGYLGMFPTAVAFLTWGYALSHMSASRLGSSTYIVPALVIAFSWLLLSEIPTPPAVAGGVLCLVGVAIATTRRRGVTATDRKPRGDEADVSREPAEAART